MSEPADWTVEVVGGPSAVLAVGDSVTAGRADGCGLSVPADGRLSRRQVRFSATPGGLRIEDLTDGRNPVFADGEPVDGAITASAAARVAAGATRFRLSPAVSGPTGGGELTGGLTSAGAVGAWTEGTVTFDARTLAAAPVTRPDRRFEALSRLPEALRTADEGVRFPTLCGLVLAGVEDADSVLAAAASPNAPAETLGFASRRDLAAPPTPPADLLAAVAADGKPALVPDGRGTGWTFAVPVGPPAGGRALVVRGTGGSAADRASDVRFAALMAEIVAAADRAARLERQSAALRPFLPPRVLEALGDDPDPARLAPAECVATVLFCDLRGFSRTSEQLADDLPGLLERVSAALSVMTRHIRENGGVTGDFLGDAALAFWGWPDADPGAPAKATAAALGIAADFAADRPAGDPLRGFRVGVGLATGPAVAGRIGTDEQAKITVFGPVANLASRLEGLCGPLRAKVVCDAATADAVRGSEGVRVRPLATVRPAKMDRAEAVSELLPPAGPSPLSDADLARYAEAVAAFTAGDWSRCAELLQEHPAADLAQDFLRAELARGHRTAPPGWDGAVFVGERGASAP